MKNRLFLISMDRHGVQLEEFDSEKKRLKACLKVNEYDEEKYAIDINPTNGNVEELCSAVINDDAKEAIKALNGQEVLPSPPGYLELLASLAELGRALAMVNDFTEATDGQSEGIQTGALVRSRSLLDQAKAAGIDMGGIPMETEIAPVDQKSPAHDLIDIIREAGHEPQSYSGRGMYGAYCVGVSLDSISESDGIPLSGSRTDSMGKGIIVYWPNVPWPAEIECEA